MTAIEQMLADEEKRRRSAIKRLQASRFENVDWTWRERMIVDAVLELWVTLTLIVEVQRVLEERRRPWWRRLLGRGAR